MNSFQKLEALIALTKIPESPFYCRTEVVGNDTYYTFSYKIASYTEFLQPMATEARGHTYLVNTQGVKLVCNPMAKFFNLNENPLAFFPVDEPEFWDQVKVYPKLDGSLISTVWNQPGMLLLKSKTVFHSDQAKAATAWLLLPEQADFFNWVQGQVKLDRTVNFEWCAPDNQIVVRYDKPSLVVLNVRDNVTDQYHQVEGLADEHYLKPVSIRSPNIHVKGLTGEEGYVCIHDTYGWFKLKSDWYSLLHKSKDSLNYMNVFEAALNDTVDGLLALFSDNQELCQRMQVVADEARTLYEQAEIELTAFLETYGTLDRKEYAIAAQKEFQPKGLFAVAMNAYLGKDWNLIKSLLKIEDSKEKIL